MFEFITYLAQSALCLVALYLIYKVTMSHETLHRLNRATLLGMVILSAVLPLCHIKVTKYIDVIAPQSIPTVENAEMVVVELAEVDYAALAQKVIVALFCLGVVLMALRLVVNTISVVRLIKRGESSPMAGGVTLSVVEQISSPFSWFGYIVMGRKDLQENKDMILAHEMAHIGLRHSWDVLFVDLALLVWWFNPALWLLRRELQSLHEYQADEEVLRRGVDAKTYQLLLIKRAVGSRLHSVANCLNHSNLKNRITMMCKKQSSKWAASKLLLVLPMVAISLSAFATTVYVTRELHDKSTENSENNKNWKKAVIEIAGSKILLNDKQVTPEELDACIEEYVLQTLIYDKNDAESVKTYESIHNTLKKNRALDQVYPDGKRPTSTIHLDGDKVYLNGELISLEELNKRVAEMNHIITITANKDTHEEEIAELKETIRHTGNVLKLNYTQSSDGPAKSKNNSEYVKTVEKQIKAFEEMKSEYEAAKKEFEARKDEFAKNEKVYAEMQKQFAELENHYEEVEDEFAKRMALYKEYSKNGSVNIRLEGGKIYLDGKLTSVEKLNKYLAENKKLINIKVADDESRETLAKVEESVRKNQILTINYEQVRFLPAEDSEKQQPQQIKVEKMPTFQGGDLNTFINWLQTNIKYPQAALDSKIQGRVIFSFVVEKDGSIGTFDALSAPDKILVDEVERVFKTSPKWEAGEQRGEKVRVKLTVPVVFALPKAETQQ